MIPKEYRIIVSYHFSPQSCTLWSSTAALNIMRKLFTEGAVGGEKKIPSLGRVGCLCSSSVCEISLVGVCLHGRFLSNVVLLPAVRWLFQPFTWVLTLIIHSFLWIISASFKKPPIVVLLNSPVSSRSFLSQKMFEISTWLVALPEKVMKHLDLWLVGLLFNFIPPSQLGSWSWSQGSRRACLQIVICLQL